MIHACVRICSWSRPTSSWRSRILPWALSRSALSDLKSSIYARTYERTRKGLGLWAANQTNYFSSLLLQKYTDFLFKRNSNSASWTDTDLLLKHLNALLVSSFIVIPLSAESLALHHPVLQEAVEPCDLLLEQSHAARSLSLGQGRTCRCQTVWLFQLLTQTPHVLLSTGVILLPLWV